MKPSLGFFAEDLPGDVQGVAELGASFGKHSGCELGMGEPVAPPSRGWIQDFGGTCKVGVDQELPVAHSLAWSDQSLAAAQTRAIAVVVDRQGEQEKKLAIFRNVGCLRNLEHAGGELHRGLGVAHIPRGLEGSLRPFGGVLYLLLDRSQALEGNFARQSRFTGGWKVFGDFLAG